MGKNVSKKELQTKENQDSSQIWVGILFQITSPKTWVGSKLVTWVSTSHGKPVVFMTRVAMTWVPSLVPSTMGARVPSWRPLAPYTSWFQHFPATATESTNVLTPLLSSRPLIDVSVFPHLKEAITTVPLVLPFLQPKTKHHDSQSGTRRSCHSTVTFPGAVDEKLISPLI